jgi:hypothetical protein
MIRWLYEVGVVAERRNPRRMSTYVLTVISFAYSGTACVTEAWRNFPFSRFAYPELALPLADSWSSRDYRGNCKKIYYFGPGTRNTSWRVSEKKLVIP